MCELVLQFRWLFLIKTCVSNVRSVLEIQHTVCYKFCSFFTMTSKLYVQNVYERGGVVIQSRAYREFHFGGWFLNVKFRHLVYDGCCIKILFS